MNPSDLPQVQPGTQWWHTRAQAWKNLFSLVLRLSNLTVGPGLILRMRGQGMTISLREDIVRPRPARRRVAVVSIGETSMAVREVRYAGKPPIVGAYKWVGEDIPAYPDVGNTWDDLEAFAWGTDTPTIATPILDAYRIDEHWYVQTPASAEREVVLRAYFEDDPGSQFVIVQEVQPEIVDGVWTGGMVVRGEPLTVNVWSNLWAELYKPFLWEPMEIDARATILPLVLIAGVWRLKQRPKMGIQRRKGPVRLLDCTTVSP